METFEITVPATETGAGPGRLEIQADHWIDAWSKAVIALGGGPADPGQVDCTFGDDGSIEVVDRTQGHRLVLRCVGVFRGREITLDSLTDLCAAPSRPAGSFAITRTTEQAPEEEPGPARARELTPATVHERPAVAWLALDLARAKDPDGGAQLLLEAFPCELVVLLRPEADGDWTVLGAAGDRGARIRGATLPRTSPIPPGHGALVGRRSFPDDERSIGFCRRFRSDIHVSIRSVIWTGIPGMGEQEPLRLMLINGPGASGFTDQDLSGAVSMARSLGARWGKAL